MKKHYSLEREVPKNGIINIGINVVAKPDIKELLEAGVRIFELQASVLHAKTAVIDGYWSTVGSTNLDMRSFLHNREVNLITLDAEFGSIMESAFSEDLKNSIEITPEKWAERPFSDRMREWTASF